MKTFITICSISLLSASFSASPWSTELFDVVREETKGDVTAFVNSASVSQSGSYDASKANATPANLLALASVSGAPFADGFANISNRASFTASQLKIDSEFQTGVSGFSPLGSVTGSSQITVRAKQAINYEVTGPAFIQFWFTPAFRVNGTDLFETTGSRTITGSVNAGDLITLQMRTGLNFQNSSSGSVTAKFTPVPEPATFAALSLGLVALRKRKQARH